MSNQEAWNSDPIVFNNMLKGVVGAMKFCRFTDKHREQWNSLKKRCQNIQSYDEYFRIMEESYYLSDMYE
jgi:hypothetical protein